MDLHKILHLQWMVETERKEMIMTNTKSLQNTRKIAIEFLSYENPKKMYWQFLLTNILDWSIIFRYFHTEKLLKNSKLFSQKGLTEWDQNLVSSKSKKLKSFIKNSIGASCLASVVYRVVTWLCRTEFRDISIFGSDRNIFSFLQRIQKYEKFNWIAWV